MARETWGFPTKSDEIIGVGKEGGDGTPHVLPLCESVLTVLSDGAFECELPSLYLLPAPGGKGTICTLWGPVV